MDLDDLGDLGELGIWVICGDLAWTFFKSLIGSYCIARARVLRKKKDKSIRNI